MITGVRGSGKTVMLTDISKHFKNEKDWIVIELNPDRDMLQGFAAKLYDYKDMKDLFIKAKIDLSVLGIGVSIEKANPFFDLDDGSALDMANLTKGYPFAICLSGYWIRHMAEGRGL